VKLAVYVPYNFDIIWMERKPAALMAGFGNANRLTGRKSCWASRGSSGANCSDRNWTVKKDVACLCRRSLHRPQYMGCFNGRRSASQKCMESKYLIPAELSLSRPRQAFRARRLRLAQFLDNRHMKVARLSPLRTIRLNPQETSLVLISVRGWVDPRP